MSQPRYLTKSRFKLGRQCPTKLYYVGKPDIYANNSFDDPFLRQLAIGGFQVGELARHYFPGGEHVLTQNYKTAVEITDDLLRRDQVVIYEAAFQHGDLFIRADILVKDGDNIHLIEVKAKSCDFEDESGFREKRGERKILGKWREQIEDVAFQKHVINLAMPTSNVRAHLMLADKTVVAVTDGLNQKFRAAYDTTGKRYIEVRGEITAEDLSARLLRVINLDACCEMIYADDYETLSFHAHVDMLADRYARDVKITSRPSATCKDCEFRQKDQNDADLQCGFRECWTEALSWQPADFDDANILDLWSYAKKNALIENGKIKMSQLVEDDIDPEPKEPAKKPGLSRPARQWLQIERTVTRDTTPFIDRDGLRAEIEKWTFPLHFIDFETAMPAIPFKAGRRPYEGIAFQFSHHVVEEDGNIRHAGQFLETTPGVFPNYEFVRELKRQLENDNGSIFRYHSHENSFLCTIREQLVRDGSDIADRRDLVNFIESIAKPRNAREHPGDDWVTPERCMIDLYDMVIRYYYDPAMGGSNSIKQVLPATLSNSDHLKAKYREAIYGGDGSIPSLNFAEPHAWVEFDENGKVLDPYHSLRGVFEGVDWTEHDYNALVGGIDDISDGGAAMAAYGKLQYEDISDLERERLNHALYKYCELDTLAMVMIYEAWKDVICA